MRKIGIISRCDRDDVLSLVDNIVKHLRSGVEVLIDPKTAGKLNLKGTQMADMRKKGAEFIISIGGDGTVLRGSRGWMIRFLFLASIWEPLDSLWMSPRLIHFPLLIRFSRL